MKYAGLRKYRWLFFALAAIAIAQSPFAIFTAISSATIDHRMILPMIIAFAIRFTFIGFFLKIWWDTRSSAAPSGEIAATTKHER